MHVDHDDDELDAPRQWTVIQFALACVGTMSVTTFTKYPMNQYYGSAWSALCYVFYLIAAAGAILYVQVRVSCEHRRSQISLFSKYLPFAKGAAIAFMIRNLLQVAQVGALMAHMLSYIMLGLYRCNGQVCVGSNYIWSTCYDSWNTPQCNGVEQRVRLGPTPEDQFLQNYFLDHPLSFDSSAPSTGQTSGPTSSPLLSGFPTWLNLPALELSMLVAAWLAISFSVSLGPRFFGLLLYGLVPAALLSFFVVFIYGFAAIARYPYANSIFSKFYGEMMTIMSKLTTQVDPYYYQPLEWGFLCSMVFMTQALQLWSGQWSSMTKWVGYGSNKRHILPVIALAVFGVLGQLPTILTIAFLSAGYELNYIRLHLIKPYSTIFIIVPRIFGMWGIHPAIMVLWFAAVFLLSLISNALLILTTVDNIIDELRRHSRKIERSDRKARNLTTWLICAFMFILGVLFITRAGMFYIVMIDYYIDLLLVFLIPIAAAAYFTAFKYSARPDGRKMKKTEKVIISVLYFLGVIISLAAFAYWLAAYIKTSAPSYDGVSFPLSLIIAGWAVASVPIIIGFGIGIPTALRESKDEGSACSRLWCGQKDETSEARSGQVRGYGQTGAQLLNKNVAEAEPFEESIDPM